MNAFLWVIFALFIEHVILRNRNLRSDVEKAIAREELAARMLVPEGIERWTYIWMTDSDSRTIEEFASQFGGSEDMATRIWLQL